MGETQTHYEEHRRSATLLVPINVGPLAGHVRHCNQSSNVAGRGHIRLSLPVEFSLLSWKWTPIYMVWLELIYQIKCSSSFTLQRGQGSMEAPPRISLRNGISVC
jgi:hypothetical protein